MKSCEICFYRGCGIKSDLAEISKHVYAKVDNQDDLKIQLHKQMGEHCSQFRRRCAKCGERIPTEEEFSGIRG